MGYYSEVKLAIKKEDEYEFNSLFEGTNESFFNDAHKSYLKSGEVGEIVLYEWDWIKFYEDYIEVIDFHELLNRADEKGAASSYIKNGEELDDIYTWHSNTPFIEGHVENETRFVDVYFQWDIKIDIDFY